MSIIKTLFKFTRIFWIISRLVLGIIFCYCAIFLLEGADTYDYLAVALFAILGLLLIWNFIAGIFFSGAGKWLRITTGISLILISLAMFYSTIDVFGVAEAAIIVILPIWFFLAGCFEIISSGRKKGSSKIADLPAGLL